MISNLNEEKSGKKLSRNYDLRDITGLCVDKKFFQFFVQLPFLGHNNNGFC